MKLLLYIAALDKNDGQIKNRVEEPPNTQGNLLIDEGFRFRDMGRQSLASPLYPIFPYIVCIHWLAYLDDGLGGKNLIQPKRNNGHNSFQSPWKIPFSFI